MIMPSQKNRWRLLILILLTSGVFITGCQGGDNLPTTEPAVPSIDITVSKEGIYQIPLSEIGWDQVDLNQVGLFHRYQPIPLWITGEGPDSVLHFYGESSASVYTDENVYQLKIGGTPSEPMEEITGGDIPDSGTVGWVYKTDRIEQNKLYSPLPAEGDHWFWTRMLAPVTYEVGFELADLVHQDGYFQVALWGYTQADADPDHRAIISINDIKVGDGTWDGQSRSMLQDSIPKDILQEGSNRLTVDIPGDTGSHIEIVFLDWVEITYSTAPSFSTDQTLFKTEHESIGFQDLTFDTFIFDISNPFEVTVQTLNKDRSIMKSQRGHRYLAVAPQGWLQPDSIEPTTINPNLNEIERKADYLVIGPQDLIEPLKPLLDLRREQGLNPLAIPVNAIYDQFNGGIAEPQALTAFLSYADEQWASPPKYVLLVGDASYDFRAYTSPKNINRLPVTMVPTVFGGETASDVAIADINEDPWPDIAIGRLPAQTPAQVETYVEKVLIYEGNSQENMEAFEILAIADRQEAVFAKDASDFLAFFPKPFNTTLLVPDSGDPSVRGRVKEAIGNNLFLIAYFGHGSVKMWGKDNLLSTEDVAALNNLDHLPVMFHFTCLTGLFTHPGTETLTESLLWNSTGGAVAVFAPTSLTLSYEQWQLAKAIAQGLYQDSNPRLGDVILSAWRQVPADSPNTRDVMLTFLLFGDPALRLPPLKP